MFRIRKNKMFFCITPSSTEEVEDSSHFLVNVLVQGLCCENTRKRDGYETLPDIGVWLPRATIRGTCLLGYHEYFSYQAVCNEVLFS
jgi:hypothetical protein